VVKNWSRLRERKGRSRGVGRLLEYVEYRRRQMVHPHWPRWASRVISDVEHQGELQIIGFVITVTMLVGALMFAVVTLIAELLQRLK
jgi:hypothetical protein